MPVQRVLRCGVKAASGQAPPVAVKPAGWLLRVLIRANRLDAGAPVLSERLRKTIADVGVASAGKFIERDRTQEPRVELVGSASLYQKHAAACIRHRHRKNQPTVRAQAVEPRPQRMGRPSAGDNDVAFAERNIRSVAIDDGDLGPRGKRLALAPSAVHQSQSPKPFRSARPALPGPRSNSPCRSPDGPRARRGRRAVRRTRTPRGLVGHCSADASRRRRSKRRDRRPSDSNRAASNSPSGSNG